MWRVHDVNSVNNASKVRNLPTSSPSHPDRPACLPRKHLTGRLVDRAVVRIRDDLLEDLCRERRCREELEGEVNQLLGGGLAAAFKEKEDELEASVLTTCAIT